MSDGFTDECPMADTHGNPFRYCQACSWVEEPETTSASCSCGRVKGWADYAADLDAARAELAAANCRIAELEADAKEVADAFIEEQRRGVDMEIERDALSARLERVKAAIREFIDDIDRAMEANPKGQGRKDAAIVRGILVEILRDES